LAGRGALLRGGDFGLGLGRRRRGLRLGGGLLGGDLLSGHRGLGLGGLELLGVGLLGHQAVGVAADGDRADGDAGGHDAGGGRRAALEEHLGVERELGVVLVALDGGLDRGADPREALGRGGADVREAALDLPPAGADGGGVRDGDGIEELLEGHGCCSFLVVCSHVCGCVIY